MNELDLAMTIADALEEFVDNQIAAGRESLHGFDDCGVGIKVYEDAGVLGANAKLIIHIAGKNFHVTINKK